MQVHVSVCSLLVCATLGFLAGADPIRTYSAHSIDENAIEDGGNVITTQDHLGMERWIKEFSVFQTGLQVENDKGELVELTLDEDAKGSVPEAESMALLNDRVFFRLYTRRNPTDYQPLWLDDLSNLARSFFDADKPTHFVTHGWMNSGNSPACTTIRDAYLENGDFNVVVVDWSKITVGGYIRAARHVVSVGQHVAKMIDFLKNNARLNPEKTILVGHSLGAHVMGLAGYYSQGTISYVIGLDPALPGFAFADVGSRISHEDAKHVQIIHTNAGLLGYLSDIGHTDFYPNGGSRQLGCFLDVGGACSHARSWRFFAESINSARGFYAKACHSRLAWILGRCNQSQTALMGGALIDLTKTGKYFLTTTPVSPFAKGL